MREVQAPPLPDPGLLTAVRARKIGSLPLAVAAMATRPDILPHLAREAVTLLGCTMLLDPDDAEAGKWLRLAGRAYTLQAGRLVPGDGPVTLDMPVLGLASAPRRTGHGALHLHQFTDACHAALALGDEEAWMILAEVPLDAVEADPAQHLLLQARSLQAYVRGDVRSAAALALEALLACNSPALAGRARDHALMVVSPEIELFNYWDQPAEDWNGRVRTAIEYNRRHAALDGDGGPTASDYVMPAAIAFAAMRHAEGLPASPAAPELPRSIVWRSPGG